MRVALDDIDSMTRLMLMSPEVVDICDAAGLSPATRQRSILPATTEGIFFDLLGCKRFNESGELFVIECSPYSLPNKDSTQVSSLPRYILVEDGDDNDVLTIQGLQYSLMARITNSKNGTEVFVPGVSPSSKIIIKDIARGEIVSMYRCADEVARMIVNAERSEADIPCRIELLPISAELNAFERICVSSEFLAFWIIYNNPYVNLVLGNLSFFDVCQNRSMESTSRKDFNFEEIYEDVFGNLIFHKPTLVSSSSFSFSGVGEYKGNRILFSGFLHLLPADYEPGKSLAEYIKERGHIQVKVFKKNQTHLFETVRMDALSGVNVWNVKKPLIFLKIFNAQSHTFDQINKDPIVVEGYKYKPLMVVEERDGSLHVEYQGKSFQWKLTTKFPEKVFLVLYHQTKSSELPDIAIKLSAEVSPEFVAHWILSKIPLIRTEFGYPAYFVSSASISRYEGTSDADNFEQTYKNAMWRVLQSNPLLNKALSFTVKGKNFAKRFPATSCTGYLLALPVEYDPSESLMAYLERQELGIIFAHLEQEVLKDHAIMRRSTHCLTVARTNKIDSVELPSAFLKIYPSSIDVERVKKYREALLVEDFGYTPILVMKWNEEDKSINNCDLVQGEGFKWKLSKPLDFAGDVFLVLYQIIDNKVAPVKHRVKVDSDGNDGASLHSQNRVEPGKGPQSMANAKNTKEHQTSLPAEPENTVEGGNRQMLTGNVNHDQDTTITEEGASSTWGVWIMGGLVVGAVATATAFWFFKG